MSGPLNRRGAYSWANSPWLHAAAAVGGAAANRAVNAALNRAERWWSGGQPNYYNFADMSAALPPVNMGRGGGRRGRGRGRGGRGRGRGRGGRAPRSGQPNAGISSPQGSEIVIRDTEVIGQTTGALQIFQFNPSIDELPRLAAYEKMYQRYKIQYMNVAYISGSATNVTGNVALGIAPGPKRSDIKTSGDIMKLRPSFYVPAWKNDSISVGRLIDSSRFMFCGNNTEDGVSFTLYVFGTKDIGMIQVSYGVRFAYPHPFT